MNGSNDEGGPVGQEKINTDIVTLTRLLTEEQTKHKEATGDFTYVVRPHLIERSCRADFIVLLGCYAMPSNSPSNRSPTTSDEHR